MASQLAQTAKTVRALLFGSVVFFILYILFTQVLGLITKITISSRPPRATPPSVAFGKLPKLGLKGLTLEGNQPTYSLETTSGTLPQMSDRAKVFKFKEPQSSFLSLERTKNLARKLGFQMTPKEISPSLYFWEEPDGRALRANTVTGNFEIEFDLSQMTLSIGDLPSPGEIKSTAKGYLDGKGLLKSGFELGTQEAILIKKNGPEMTRALSLSETSLARIDLFRAVKSEETTLPALPLDPKKGLVEMFYAGQRAIVFPKIKYTVWEFDFETGETYPLLSIDSAWQEISANKGFVTFLQYQGSDSLESLSSLEAESVFIRKVYLAYFDDEYLQRYFQPIYVFEGDGKAVDGKAIDIVLYHPAIDPAWTE